MMELIIKWMITICTVALFMASNIECPPVDNQMLEKCHDIPDAVNFLYQLLPKQMNFEEKCMRYALLTYLFENRRLPIRLAVSKLAELPPEVVQTLYLNIGVRELSGFYMVAIDGYRSSSLEIALLDLFECLKLIDTPYGEIYLKNPELILTINLYKQVLNSSEKIIDFSKVDWKNIHPRFQSRLKILFNESLPGCDNSSEHSSVPFIARGRPRSSSASSSNTPEQNENLSEEQTKELMRGRQGKLRESYPQRHREQERLRQQRLRILNPEVVRERVRRWEQRRRQKRQERLDENRRTIQEEIDKNLPYWQHYLQQATEGQISPILESQLLQESMFLTDRASQQGPVMGTETQFAEQLDARQARFENPQSLVNPRTSKHMDPRTGSSSSQYDNNRHQQVMDNRQSYSSMHPGADYSFSSSQDCNYIFDSGTLYGQNQSGELASSLGAIEHFPNSYGDFASQLDDTDVVVQSIANYAPTDATGATSFGTNRDLGDPWDEFDREFSKRGQI